MEPDFRIAVSGGVDSDSIFQEGVASALDQDLPEDFSSDEQSYDEEDEDEAQDMSLLPRQLPLETILEENSQLPKPKPALKPTDTSINIRTDPAVYETKQSRR